MLYYRDSSVSWFLYTTLLLVSPSLQQGILKEEDFSSDTTNTTAANVTTHPEEQKEVSKGAKYRSSASAKLSFERAHGHEERYEDNTQILILREGDPHSVLDTDEHTGCMFLDEEHLPQRLNGKQSFGQTCDPDELDNVSLKCQLYITAPVDMTSHQTCLKPTHLLCDPATRKCACGNEGTIIPTIRFQYGNYAGKNFSEGICFVRPTFDFIPGFECAPGTEKLLIAVEEDADSIPLCICKGENDFDKFDSSDESWWKCGMASSIHYSYSLLLFTVMVNMGLL